MKLNAIFLEERELDRLEIAIELSKRRGGKTTILELGERFFLSYSQVYRLLKQMDSELSELNQGTSGLEIKKGYLKIESWFPNVERYRSYLIQKSVPYLFLVNLLEKDCVQIDQFLVKHQLSKTSFYNKTKNLRQFAKDNRLHLSLTDFKLVGDEFAVRQFFFCLLWLITKGAVCRCESNMMLELKSTDFLDQQSYLLRAQLAYLLVISEKRMQQGYFYQPRKGLDKLLVDYKGVAITDVAGCLDDVIRHNENLFLRLYAMMSHSFLTTLLPREKTSNYFDLPEAHPINRAAYLIHQLLRKEKLINLHPNQAPVYQRAITYLCTIQYFVPQAFVSVASFSEQSKVLLELDKQISTVLEDYQEKLTDYLGYVDLPFLSRRLATMLIREESYRLCQLKVGLALEVTDPTVKKLVSKLLAMKTVEVEWFSSQQTYDYVIHSLPYFENDYPRQKAYYWQYFCDDQELESVLQELSTMSRG